MALKIPEEIVAKVEAFQKAKEEGKALFADLRAFFDEDMDGAYMENFCIVDEPTGQEQNGGEYCNQITGMLGDDFSGTYYYPIGDGRYIAIEYCM